MRHLLQVIPWLLLLPLSLASPNKVKCYYTWGYDPVINKCVEPYPYPSLGRIGNLQPTILIKPNCADGHVWQQEQLECVKCPAKGCNHRVNKPQIVIEKRCPYMHKLDVATNKCVKIVPRFKVHG
ncbi:uncharacterized protein LOC116804114 [Drosophila mojavensis]|uniref:uncharacterized protein LOC116804114 n=1 Tax=Drosophila mojavensis TaxID=7230 RepID=UPI0013EE78FA|nr:uncharacterized protein LOC116804114 [Drosophila mojavensis]